MFPFQFNLSFYYIKQEEHKHVLLAKWFYNRQVFSCADVKTKKMPLNHYYYIKPYCTTGIYIAVYILYAQFLVTLKRPTIILSWALTHTHFLQPYTQISTYWYSQLCLFTSIFLILSELNKIGKHHGQHLKEYTGTRKPFLVSSPLLTRFFYDNNRYSV